VADAIPILLGLAIRGVVDSGVTYHAQQAYLKSDELEETSSNGRSD